MEKFEFENYRDKLAKELREARGKDNRRKDAKEILESAKNSGDYQDARKLHRIRNEFPKQVVNEAMDYPERVDDPALWDIEDISDRILEEYKYEIDKAILHDISNKVYLSEENNKERWDVEERIAAVRGKKTENEDVFEKMREDELEIKKMQNILDTLSGYRFLDRHNLNHLVMGHGGTAKHYRAKAFDRYSKIEASSAENINNGFWMNIAEGHYISLSKPTVIFSPDNIATRRFFENKFDPPIDELLKELTEKEMKDPGSGLRALKKRLVFDYKSREFKGFNVSSYRGDSDLARILFLAGFPISSDGKSGKAIFFPFESEYEGVKRHNAKDYSKVPVEEKWMDISDCIIDLRTRKVWKRKYTQEEVAQAKKEKEKYKKWIEKNLLNCTFEELISFKK